MVPVSNIASAAHEDSVNDAGIASADLEKIRACAAPRL